MPSSPWKREEAVGRFATNGLAICIAKVVISYQIQVDELATLLELMLPLSDPEKVNRNLTYSKSPVVWKRTCWKEACSPEPWFLQKLNQKNWPQKSNISTYLLSPKPISQNSSVIHPPKALLSKSVAWMVRFTWFQLWLPILDKDIIELAHLPKSWAQWWHN